MSNPIFSEKNFREGGRNADTSRRVDECAEEGSTQIQYDARQR